MDDKNSQGLNWLAPGFSTPYCGVAAVTSNVLRPALGFVHQWLMGLILSKSNRLSLKENGIKHRNFGFYMFIPLKWRKQEKTKWHPGFRGTKTSKTVLRDGFSDSLATEKERLVLVDCDLTKQSIPGHGSGTTWNKEMSNRYAMVKTWYNMTNYTSVHTHTHACVYIYIYILYTCNVL